MPPVVDLTLATKGCAVELHCSGIKTCSMEVPASVSFLTSSVACKPLAVSRQRCFPHLVGVHLNWRPTAGAGGNPQATD
jgi:hypothetical protein